MSCHTPLLGAEGIIYCMCSQDSVHSSNTHHNQQRLAVLQLPSNQRGGPFEDEYRSFGIRD